MWQCRHSEQLTDAMEGAMPFWRRVFHRLHMAVCVSCRCTESQLRTTMRAVGNLPSEPPRPEVKQRLLEEFRSRCKKG